ncbi:hypothetical protein RB2150_09359 [Rhodobacterales bacterium HTCC2150]|jgi:hypothetical protein|nr:hypothetical protein RB2150_09359 [Rhodobacterales bacterium HTCC2150] [Rhodobacteraceae bacterium HTCC2150]
MVKAGTVASSRAAQSGLYNHLPTEKEKTMKNTFINDTWSGVMDHNKNPLRNYPLATAHMLMQMLAWMWSAVFSILIGSYFVFGITAIGHGLVISALFITLTIFQQAEQKEKSILPQDGN